MSVLRKVNAVIYKIFVKTTQEHISVIKQNRFEVQIMNNPRWVVEIFMSARAAK